MALINDILPIAYFVLDEQGCIAEPISSYTKSYFKEEFKLGDNVFERIFKQGDEKYAIHESNWLSMFGSDDLQYSLSVDELIPKTYFEKELSLTYTPIWDQEENLEKMIVSFNDLSELTELKEVYEQSKVNEIENNNIIRELTEVEKEDIKTFLSENLDFIKRLKNLAQKLKNSPEELIDIKRYLHTLKGNSRMLKFELISQLIHESETRLSDIDPANIEQNDIYNILTEVNKITRMVSKYSALANKIFKIKDKHYINNVSDFHRLNGKMQQFYEAGQRDLAGFIQEAQELSHFVATKELQKKIYRLNDLLSNYQEAEVELKEYFKAYWEFFLSTHFVDTLQFNPQVWIPIIQMKIFISESGPKDAKMMISELKGFCRNSELLFMERLYTDLLKASEKNKNYDAILRYSWNLLAVLLNQICHTYYTENEIKMIIENNNFKDFSPDDVFGFFMINHREKLLNIMKEYCRFEGDLLKYLMQTHIEKEQAKELLEMMNSSILIDDIQKQKDLPLLLRNIATPPFNAGSFFLNSFIYRILKTNIRGHVQESKYIKPVLSIYSKNIMRIQEIYDQIKTDLPEFKKLAYYLKNIENFPLDFYFKQLFEMTHDVSQKLGKEIHLAINSDLIFLDKKRSLLIKDCLVHMLRNSIDHGIEMPNERKKKKKNIKGLIQIDVKEKDGKVVLIVSDDGNGLDREKIRKKVNLDDKASDQEIFKTIFLSSFSTKEEVSDLSGRGVGMNAVLSIIEEELDGSIRVESELNKGLKFTIEIPKN